MNKFIFLFFLILLNSLIGNSQNSIQIEIFSSLDKTDLPFHECEVQVNNTSVNRGVLIRSIRFDSQLIDDKRYSQPNNLKWDKEDGNYFRGCCSIEKNETFYEIFIPPGGIWKFQRHLEFDDSLRCNIEWLEIEKDSFCSNILINNPNPPEKKDTEETKPTQGPRSPLAFRNPKIRRPTGPVGLSTPVSCSIAVYDIYSPYCKVKKDNINSDISYAVIVKDDELKAYSNTFILEEYSDGNYSNLNCFHETSEKVYEFYKNKFSCRNFDFCPSENRVFQLYPDIFISYQPSPKFHVDELLEVQVIQIYPNGNVKKKFINRISYRAILHIQKTKEEGFSVTLNNEYSDLFQIPERYNYVKIKSSDQFIKLMKRAEELGSTLKFNRWNCNWYGLSMWTSK